MAIIVEHKNLRIAEIRDIAGALLLSTDGTDLILNAPASGGDLIWQTGLLERWRYDPGGDEFIFTGAGNGNTLRIGKTSFTHTTNSGTGTETIVGSRPAGRFIIGVTSRITTVLSGAGLTTFGLGDGTVTDRYGATLPIADSSTSDGDDWTADPFEVLTADGNIVLTADAGQFDGGVIAVTTHFLTLTAATTP